MNRSVWRWVGVLVFGSFGLGSLCAAPTGYYLPEEGPYDQRVPTPESYFGYQVGEWHLRPDQIEGYLRTVAAAAPERARFEVFGQSVEQRNLVHLVVTAPEHLSRLDEVRRQHRALSDPARSAAVDLATQPAVVNLGYSIHGNESSGANAAVLVAYWLVASESPAAQRARAEVVTWIDPMFNPDGVARFAQWANGHRGAQVVADPYHREHREPWPSGRVNHYWFDLNRDWFALVHPESRARAAWYQMWKPNIMNDHHEMGTEKTYFFQPGSPSRNNPSTPARVFQLQARLAEYHAAALDRKGSFYYTAEGYDDFYAGKGSVYPDLNGGLGILFEQASSRGHRQETDFGDLEFSFTIRNQVVTSLSTLEAAVEMRLDLLEHQRTFYATAGKFAHEAGIGGWVFDSARDPARAWELRSMLAQHDIEVRELRRDLEVGGHTYAAGRAWVVPASQPQARLLAELFTRRTEFEDTAFYDISAWSVPLAFNLPHAQVAGEAFAASGGLAGELRPLGPRPVGRLTGRRENVLSYVVGAVGADLPRVLGRLARAGIGAQVATKSFGAVPAGEATLQRFEAGSVIVPVGRQAAKAAAIEQVIDAILAEDAVEVFALAGGLTPEGPDMGSPSWVTVSPGRVALVVGEGLSLYDAGELWHTLDVRWQLPVTLLEASDVGRTDLSRYDTIILVDGTYAGISATAAEGLKTWTRAGGTLLVFERAIPWVAEKLGSKLALLPEPKSPEQVGRQPFGESEDIERAKRIPGSIFAAEVDGSHPLAFGLDAPMLPIFRAGTRILQAGASPYGTPLVYAKKPLLAGYAPAEEVGRLGGQAAAVVEILGRGRIVAMTDNPVFRGYWFGGMRLLGNAIFFGPAMAPFGGGASEEAASED